MVHFPHRHLLGIKGLTPPDIALLLDRADEAVKISRQREKKTSTLRGLSMLAPWRTRLSTRATSG